ncbi:hypothetical protein ASE23_26595 [Rhizobium sp. Root73]|uniref:EexN family lipoprotein n=1 Tax=unclassified Rhizobium TaxID=2613769 RepID=UPI0007256FF5|nr:MULTISPECIES: EexN family lipoprotein [unclassified Rhizobium]KQY15050.1 hypothetical protein ASD36_26050 [Rhizobium sp. Root1334]KRC06483.1 hypothetical protein ASE23_26595 [Rhizobium sp. Root73]
MKQALFGLVVSAPSACSGPFEKTYTGDELMADEPLLVRIMGECRNNPGTLRDKPNSQNPAAADRKVRRERIGKSLGG